MRVKHYQTVVQVLAPITTCPFLLRHLWQPPLLYQRLLIFPSAPPHSRPGPTAAALSFCAILSPRTSGCCPFFGSRPSSTSGHCSFLRQRPSRPISSATAYYFASAPLGLPHLHLFFPSAPPSRPIPSAAALSVCAAPLSPHPIGALFISSEPLLSSRRIGRCSFFRHRPSRPVPSAAAYWFRFKFKALFTSVQRCWLCYW